MSRPFWPTFPTSLRLDEDLHIHSTFSDGEASIDAVLRRALERRLRRVAFVDHVRRDTRWLPSFTAAVTHLRNASPIPLLCGVEAKILDESGRLDMPEDVTGIDLVVVADHRMPFEDRCLTPPEARALLTNGSATSARLIRGLLDATKRAATGQDRPVLVAHLFSILPKIGLPEDTIDRRALRALADALAEQHCAVEISERWRCPGPRTLDILARAGVPIVASTDSHTLDAIGRYRYVAERAQALGIRIDRTANHERATGSAMATPSSSHRSHPYALRSHRTARPAEELSRPDAVSTLASTSPARSPRDPVRQPSVVARSAP